MNGILTHPDLEGKRAKWIVVLLEYDIEINPTKLIKGQVLEKMMTNSNCESLQLNFLTSHSNQIDTEMQVMPYFSISPWYSDIVYVLQNLQAPARLRKIRSRSVKLKYANFFILNQYLYWKDPGGVLLSCLLENEAKKTIKEFHKGDCGERHSWKVTTNKILRDGF